MDTLKYFSTSGKDTINASLRLGLADVGGSYLSTFISILIFYYPFNAVTISATAPPGMGMIQSQRTLK